MDPSQDAHAAAMPIASSGRRDAVRSLAGIGESGLAMLGLHQQANASPETDPAGPVGPEYQNGDATKQGKPNRRDSPALVP